MRVSWLRYQETVATVLEILAVQDVATDLRRLMTLDLGDIEQ